ncbi:aspartic peptidase domain-containing protein [Mycena epipterygia]|nr:aspartic peptidase domain-containing protein [Mycena epipterygia]
MIFFRLYAFDVILDTGSADLSVAGSTCTEGCVSAPRFDSSASSTFKNESIPFSITYGTSGAVGVLASDTVQMAGFSVSNQVFAPTRSGVATPLQFRRHTLLGDTCFRRFLRLARHGLSTYTSKSQDIETGGSFTMGVVNSTLYTGDIE